MARSWFATCNFCVLRCMKSSLYLGFLGISLISEIDWDATGVGWFSLDIERSKFIFMPLAPGVARKHTDKTETIERHFRERSSLIPISYRKR